MNIKSITPKKISYSEIKQRKNKQNNRKETIKKAILITSAISAAALTGMLMVKKTDILKKLPSVANKNTQSPKNDFLDSFAPKAKRNDTQIIKTTLSNGVEKVDKITHHALYGSTKKTKLSSPINGVKAIETFTYPNGDISKISAFDASGNIVKNIEYNYSYASKKGLDSILVTTPKGETQIDFEYLRHLPEKVKSIKISHPDDTSKLTSIPLSLKDKLMDMFHK